MPHVAAIYLYPIKALDPVSVREATVLESGMLDFDREFALVDAQDRYLNGKNNPKVHRLRAHCYPETGLVAFQAPETDEMPVFHLEDERPAVEEWLSKYFEMPVRIKQDYPNGFPDDRKAWGPTVLGQATLQEVGSWFDKLDAEQMRLRFRPNIVLAGALAFWEERLYAEPGYVVRFQIGKLHLEGMYPCRRCVVPTRDPFTGEPYPEFQRVFVEQRERTLPPFAAKGRFDHFFRLAVNTRIPKREAGKVIRVGQRVRLMEVLSLKEAEQEKKE